MGRTNVNVSIDPNAVRYAVKRAVGPVVRRRVERAGKQMVQTANELMAAQFNSNRPFERRRYPGSRRASTALDYQITTTSDDRLELRFRVLGGEQVLKRIIFMNWGTRPHRIYPSGAWELKGVTGSVQQVRTGGGSRSSSRSMLAWVDENGSVVTPEVDHPGQAGTGFLQDAARRAAASLGSTYST